MQPYYRVNPQSAGNIQPHALSILCPNCRQRGIFTSLFPSVSDASFSVPVFSKPNTVTTIRAGVRCCPNTDCRALVFVLCESDKLVLNYPKALLDFDPNRIPPAILASFQEALNAYSCDCYRASAIMIRRTLEEICADKGATGKDLKARLSALRSSVLIPQPMLDATHELRLLGNDAAHLEHNVYDQIGNDELTVAIELCKELVKAVYQYESLLEKLRALRK